MAQREESRLHCGITRRLSLPAFVTIMLTHRRTMYTASNNIGARLKRSGTAHAILPIEYKSAPASSGQV